MRRRFWVSLGAGMSVLILRKSSQLAKKLTPQHLAGNVGEALSELATSVGSFTAEVRVAMAARERELRAAGGHHGAPGQLAEQPRAS